ncbi:hypothetical protein K0U00_09965 [Paenibacillus sepulcri]|uniref:Uncharacterized protein n=2 Tax=Paenibacillus sepulcri TaxID=359917 RepID=A0ABS7C0K2_9BACL|nr:hypothetical protein [Paenibacillus sepulcri]
MCNEDYERHDDEMTVCLAADRVQDYNAAGCSSEGLCAVEEYYSNIVLLSFVRLQSASAGEGNGI